MNVTVVEDFDIFTSTTYKEKEKNFDILEAIAGKYDESDQVQASP